MSTETGKRKKTVLIVVAHADDMEFMAAGTVARFTQELGYDVYEYILTDNGRGSYRLPYDELVAVSEQEAIDAGKILGLREVRFERYLDGDLNTVHPNELRDKIMRLIREVRADIVMSWDPFAPYEDHPDHRMVSMATLDAASFSGNPMFYPEHPHAPYPVTEAYWFAKSPMNAHCFVDISGVIDTKIAALLAHDCQMVLTVDALVQEAKTVGVDLPFLQDLGADGHRGVIEMGVRQWCASIGEERGFAYAEQFRYEKLGMLDKVLGMSITKPDFI